MKTYYEMTESVLEKARTDIVKKERRRRNGVFIAASGLCAVLLLTVIGTGLKQTSAVVPTLPGGQHGLLVDPTDASQPTQPQTKVKITYLTNVADQELEESVSAGVTFPLDGMIRVRDVTGLDEEEWEKALQEERTWGSNNVWNGNASLYQWGCTGAIITLVSNGHLTLELGDCSPISNIDVETTGTGDVKLQKSYSSSKSLEEMKSEPWAGIIDADVAWSLSSQMVSVLEKNPTMPLSSIRDTITITINYANGTVETLIFDITVNEEGQIFVTQQGIPTEAA